MRLLRVKIVSATPYTDVPPTYSNRIGEETWVMNDIINYMGKNAYPECDEHGKQTGKMIQVSDVEVLKEVDLSKYKEGNWEEYLKAYFR